MKQIFLQKSVMIFMMMIVPMSLKAQKSPRAAVRYAVNQLEKENGEPIEHVIVIAQWSHHETVKKRLRTKAVEALNTWHPKVIEASDAHIKAMSVCIQRDTGITAVTRYSCLKDVLRSFEQRIKLCEFLRESPTDFSVTTSNLDELRSNFEAHKELLSVIREDAADFLLVAGDSAIIIGDSTKSAFRIAHSFYSRCAKIYPGFRDVDERLKEAEERGTVAVWIKPVGSESGTANYGAAKALNTEIALRVLDENPHPFMKIYTDLPEGQKADVTIEVTIISTSITVGDIAPTTKNYSKEVLVDGAKKKVNAKFTKTIREKYCTVIGKMVVIDLSGELGIKADPVKVSGQYIWTHHSASVSGNKDAIPKKLKYLIGKPKPYPNNTIMTQRSVQDIWYRGVQPVLQMIRTRLN